MLPPTAERVTRHSPEHVNQQIMADVEQRLRYYAQRIERIDNRLRELDAEWDIERSLEANAASFTLLGVALTAFVNRRLAIFPAIIAGFLLQHALQGWCPPLPIMRRLGIRTQMEIDTERDGLKALRGDYDDIDHNRVHGGDGHGEIRRILNGVRRR